MKVLVFIFKNWSEVLALIVLCIAIVVAGIYWFKKTKLIFEKMTPDEIIAYVKRLLSNLMPIALKLVTEAEAEYGGGTGKIKRSYVIDELYKRIPDEYKKYVTEDNLDAIINDSLIEAESLWDTNPNIQRIVYGKQSTTGIGFQGGTTNDAK